MLKIGVLGSARGSDLPNIVESINKGELKGLTRIVSIISDKENSGILHKAENYKIKNYYLNPAGIQREEYDKKILEIFEEEDVGLIACIGYMKLLSSGFINEYRNRIMNIHPSLLPYFPGIDLNVHNAVLDYGCKLSGCTLFFVDEGKDTGPIIMQKAVPVYNNDDAETLKARVQTAEQKIYPKGIKLFAQGKLKVEGRKVIILP
jgi:phosphoribosylglycinamide formyltransferase 1